MSKFATTPEPPYYAVIFTNQRSSVDDEGYSAMAERMVKLAACMDGYLGVESTRDGDGLGITVSYWRDEASIAEWKKQSEHVEAREYGNRKWYDHYELRVAKVERCYDGPRKRVSEF